MLYVCSATPISYKGDEMSCPLLSFFISDAGYTDDRQITDVATETEGSHTVSV